MQFIHIIESLTKFFIKFLNFSCPFYRKAFEHMYIIFALDIKNSLQSYVNTHIKTALIFFLLNF